jgi:2-polyprenyl-3-methyl-5-hydroxy-6-metoxy-1,4-benzoquinol methylase
MSEKPQRLYDEWHDQHEVDAAADAPWHMMIRKHIVPARDLTNKSVLEIGCGRGGFSCWLAEHPDGPTQVVAADFSQRAIEKAVAHARLRSIGKITWAVQDIQAIDYPANTFDTVFSCETIEHVLDPAKAVKELARVLRPGGKLFLTTPNYMNLVGLHRAYLRLTGRRFTETGQPINNLTLLPRTLAWVSRAGLRGRLVDGQVHFLPVPGRPPYDLAFCRQIPVVRHWFALHPLIVAHKPSAYQE